MLRHLTKPRALAITLAVTLGACARDKPADEPPEVTDGTFEPQPASPAPGAWGGPRERGPAARGPRGPQGRGPMGARGGMDGADMQAFHYLFDHRDAIHRTVELLPDGVETVTESADPEVRATLREHVAAMVRRMKEHRPIHARDPLFAELFARADAIDVSIEQTANGVRVRETSTDAWVVKLIQAHADVVGRFITHGHAEMAKDHPLPPR